MSEIINWLAERWAVMSHWSESQPTNGDLLLIVVFGVYFLNIMMNAGISRILNGLETIRQAIRQPPYDPY